MDEQMFCFQCEQAAGCTACTGAAGVCGKSAETAAAQDRLTGALIAFAGQLIAAGRGPTPEQARLLMQGLFTTITNVNFDPAAVDALTRRVHDASPGTGPDYDMQALWREPDADRRSLKCFVLFSLRGMAAYNYHARVLGRIDPELDRFFCTALQAVGDPGQTTDALWQLVQATGEASYRCMELLDAANTGAFGDPEPVQVPLTIEKGPFIVISGHDLYDAQQLLEQTAGRGVNVYTHSEMLPAHGYPELKRRYPHLKGNFGTAWQNQQREFEDIPAPILFTTNCIMPLRASYADRVFTTSVVAYPGVPHIDEGRDFSPVIEKALELGGYAQDTLLPGLNGGSTVTTGFARTAVLQHADEIVQAVRDGKLRHFFLVGGCDGTRPSRRYYTEFARLTPPDTILLTLACGKFRLNDLPLGTVPGTGLPRILDVGQCNDAYSAIRIALALADAFGCGVNDLPLSLVLCWFEQKAVCILIALLALGIRNIRLGPTLPPFLSPGWCAPCRNGTASSPLPPRKPTCRPFWAGEVSFGYFATNPQIKAFLSPECSASLRANSSKPPYPRAQRRVRRFCLYTAHSCGGVAAFRTRSGAMCVAYLVQLSLEDFSGICIISDIGTKAFRRGILCPCGALFLFAGDKKLRRVPQPPVNK